MSVECGFNPSLIGFNIVRLHGWFSPAVWPLLLCGLDNEPEWHRGREIQAFTAFVGCCAGWSAGWGRAESSAPMHTDDPTEVAGCLRVFIELLNGDGCGQLCGG